MSNGPLSWDGQMEDGLRELRRSHPDQVHCDEILRAIQDRKEKQDIIIGKKGGDADEQGARQDELAGLDLKIQGLEALARFKGCDGYSN